MQAVAPARQCGAPRSERSTLNAGRGAGSGYWLVSIGCTSQSNPAAAIVAIANSYQEHCSAAATCSGPSGRDTAIPTSADARWPVNVGQPTWSSTTLSSSRSAATRSIVFGKQGPPAPNSHEDRTIVCASGASDATASSPASLERPYADSGPVGSDSR